MILHDAHNHLADFRLKKELPQIFNEFKKFNEYSCVVNGTHPKDWPRVTELANEHPKICHPAYGLHPWHVNDYYDSDWQPLLESYLEKNPTAGIGECGLDKWIPNHQIEIQCKAFEIHLELAKKYRRPIYIHCLKAWEPLINSLEAAQLKPRTFLIHAFSGSKETAHKLLKLGAMFSFSGYFLHAKKEKVFKLYQELPLENILIETDSPSMPLPQELRKFALTDDAEGSRNHPANIEITLKSLIEARTESEEAIMNTLIQNYKSLIGV